MNDEKKEPYKKFHRTLENRNAADKNRKNEFSKQKLKSLIKKHMTTMMIGNLAKVESYFGNSWGHGLKESECDNEQLDKYLVWEQCRDEILTQGNKLINTMISELNGFDILYKGNQYIFYNKKEQ